MFKHTKGQDLLIKTNEDFLIDLCENCLIEYFAKVLSELEETDKESGKMKQKSGIEIIENPSKTEEYNAKMRKGGEIIPSKGFSDKSFHFVKRFNDFK